MVVFKCNGYGLCQMCYFLIQCAWVRMPMLLMCGTLVLFTDVYSCIVDGWETTTRNDAEAWIYHCSWVSKSDSSRRKAAEVYPLGL